MDASGTLGTLALKCSGESWFRVDRARFRAWIVGLGLRA